MSVFVIAEAGVNHNGDRELAFQLVDAAVEAGADAVKFQTFKADELVSRYAPKAGYQEAATEKTETQWEMLKKLELSDKTHRDIADYCRSKGIQWLSTPFDEVSLDFLVDELNLSLIKLASGEITNGPMVLKAAGKGRPIILSTGMSTLDEIEVALGVVAFGFLKTDEPPSLTGFRNAYRSYQGQRVLQQNVRLLHCTTEYPAPFDEVHLRAMPALSERFGLPVGYSDHTRCISVAQAAVALGAVVLEKHFTLDRNFPGPDHKASLEPRELAVMIRSVREIERALGKRCKIPTASEMKNIPVVRKSLVAARDIAVGETFTTENLAVKRPGTGISPMKFWEVLGQRVNRRYRLEELIEP